MKPSKIFLTILFTAAMGVTTFAQSHDHNNMNMNQSTSKTESFKVFGKCDMCKARIEKAAKDEGSTTASWDSKTQILAVTFDPSKTSKDTLTKKLAFVGHDTEKYKAQDEIYAKLPVCCNYERAR
jgi:hypothetical protein